ncbi:hypothetical protein TRVL_07599 [Trypanosoma vivax]|nr:hypothetical protein TRVL_07599 [Trypanosoma vivax]
MRATGLPRSVVLSARLSIRKMALCGRAEKTIRGLRGAPPLERLAVAELERLTLLMAYAVGVRGGALLEDCFFPKAMGRRLPKLNKGLSQLNDGAGLPAHAVGQGKIWQSPLLVNKTAAPRRRRPHWWQAPPRADGARFCLRIALGARVGPRAALHQTGRGARRFAVAQFLCISGGKKSSHLPR